MHSNNFLTNGTSRKKNYKWQKQQNLPGDKEDPLNPDWHPRIKHRIIWNSKENTYKSENYTSNYSMTGLRQTQVQNNINSLPTNRNTAETLITVLPN